VPAKFDRRRASIVAFDSLSWEPPAAVVLDTSVVAEALLFDEPEHAVCDILLKRLTDEGTMVVFNRLLEIELWEVLFNQALRAALSSKDIRHGRFESNARAAAGAALADGMRGWSEIRETLDWQYVELDDVADAVPDLMRSYGLQSYDAVHAATLLASGVTDIVTRDAGYAVLLPEDATLHTTAARLSRTRSRRRRARDRSAAVVVAG
jgi:predicted nucleic acid-binding protein